MPGAGAGESKESSKRYESQTMGSDPGLVGLAQLVSRTLSLGKGLRAPLSLASSPGQLGLLRGEWLPACTEVLIQQLPTQCPQYALPDSLLPSPHDPTKLVASGADLQASSGTTMGVPEFQKGSKAMRRIGWS